MPLVNPTSGASEPSDFQPEIVTGRYYTPPAFSFYNNSNAVQDQLIAYPIWFSHDETWTRIGLFSQASDSSHVRIGIYESGADNLPGALLIDAGEITLDATGIKEITISQALAANTLYWLAAIHDTSATIAGCFQAPLVGWTAGLTSFDAAGAQIPYVSGTYGALPDPFGTPTDYALGDTAPVIWLRKV